MWPRQPSAWPEGKRSAKGEQLVLRAARPAEELPQVLRVIPLPAHTLSCRKRSEGCT